MNWDTRFAHRTQQMKRSTVREILKLAVRPDVISFGGGLPAPELFPVERIEQAAETVLAERGREALQYSTTEGMPELREWVASRMSRGSFQIDPRNILIVSGSQQGLDLVGRVLLDERDPVLVENPTYVGMLSAWKPYELDFHAVPTDDDGLIVDALEPMLRQQAYKLMYSIPSFQNPQGTTLTAPRRRRLAELIVEHDLPFYEDDPYGELVYDGEKMPTVLECEAAARGTTSIDDCNIIYAGSFSKIMTPGLRVGWIAAAFPVIDKLVQAKQASDMHASTLSQYIIYEVIRDAGFVENHIAKLRQVYKGRRDLMLQTMAEQFPEGVTWTHPTGGLFTMVTLPEGMNAVAVLEESVKHNVAFVPTDSFFIGDTGHNTFRLNFSNAREERIVEGITRLGQVLKEMLVKA
ncbi:MAG TPA: PLP-dependent aminotransferase family protein [Aggregatilineales bacterium]|nr:PLP-dependent aminotransferase family protein [Aggregatilineales bacterium]